MFIPSDIVQINCHVLFCDWDRLFWSQQRELMLHYRVMLALVSLPADWIRCSLTRLTSVKTPCFSWFSDSTFTFTQYERDGHDTHLPVNDWFCFDWQASLLLINKLHVINPIQMTGDITFAPLLIGQKNRKAWGHGWSVHGEARYFVLADFRFRLQA